MEHGSNNALTSLLPLPLAENSGACARSFAVFAAQDDGWAGSRFGCRFNKVICLIRAESDGLHVATSGSSLKALCTIRRS